MGPEPFFLVLRVFRRDFFEDRCIKFGPREKLLARSLLGHFFFHGREYFVKH